MKLSKFDFKFDNSLIASYPLPRRDDACLVVADRATEEIDFYTFREFPQFFDADDVLVVNNTLVGPCYMEGWKLKTGSKLFMIMLRELDPEHHLWEVWLEPARKIRTGNKLIFGNRETYEAGNVEGTARANVIDNTESGGRAVKFEYDGSSEELRQIFEQIGHPPIPGFLNRSYEPSDQQNYRTIYQEVAGSVAPPSAGFPFTRYLFKYLELHDIHIAPITLHLSINRFKPIEAEELSKFRVDTEYYNIPEETAKRVNACLARPENKVCVVGTSSLKAVETAISHEENLKAGEGMSFLFPHPPFKAKITNSLLTGFHRPRSIDFVNFLAFAGAAFGMEIYEAALEEKLRFGPYGDVVLVL